MPRPYVQACCKGTLATYRAGVVRFGALACGSWSCPHCRRSLAARTLDRLRRGLEARAGSQLTLVTLTLDPAAFGAYRIGSHLWDDGRETNLWSEPTRDQFGTAVAVMSAAFSQMMERLNVAAARRGLDRFGYFRVVELHRNLWPHYHVVLEHPELGVVGSGRTVGTAAARPPAAEPKASEGAVEGLPPATASRGSPSPRRSDDGRQGADLERSPARPGAGVQTGDCVAGRADGAPLFELELGWTLGISDVRAVDVDTAVGELAPYLVATESKGRGSKGYQFAASALPKHFRLYQPSRGFLPPSDGSDDAPPDGTLVLRGHFTSYHFQARAWGAESRLALAAPTDLRHRPPAAAIATGDGVVILYAELAHARALHMDPARLHMSRIRHAPARSAHGKERAPPRARAAPALPPANADP